MYWLYGSPSTFAAANRQVPPRSTITSNDDAPTPVHELRSNPISNGESSITETETEEQVGDINGKGAIEEEDNEKLNERERSASYISRLYNGTTAALEEEIVGLCVSRTGHVFVTITASTVTIWQTKPTVAVGAVVRSPRSLKSYGTNLRVVLRPDSAILVVQTSLGFLITYSLATDPNARIYRPHFPETTPGHARRKSFSGRVAQRGNEPPSGPGEGAGIWEVSVQFRMVMRVPEGVSSVIALDDELILSTKSPAVVHCIRWRRDTASAQTSTAALKTMAWMSSESEVIEIVHDRPMNISTWISKEGKAYAVQRTKSKTQEEEGKPVKLFKGFCFHAPEDESAYATKTAINARFSLIAVGCADGTIRVYTAKDYAGHIPLSHTSTVSMTISRLGKITFLSYSPDGYCLFAGYERGWASWSVYGKPGVSSFISDRTMAKANDETWLLGIQDGFWIGSGSELVLLSKGENRFWIIDMARSAVAGCFSSANVARSLLQTSTGFMIYRGHDLPDLNALSSEYGLWHHVQVPSNYLAYQWPIRSAVISTDGRYVAIAGRRGLAHYSVNSARWKTFDDPADEDDFTVRGGMCWHQHLLIAAVESNDSYELRIYSREAALDSSHVMHVEQIPAPIVLIAPSGEDSLLVYTYENNLHHYVINFTNKSVKLVQVGQIALHGIIRAPPRVRALSWILPEEQLQDGDPAQDVTLASLIFLVDGKLVTLQPSTNENGELKYDMRIVAQNVEYYGLMRDQSYARIPSISNLDISNPPTSESSSGSEGYAQNDLRDSLWYFDGQDMKVWTDVSDILISTSPEFSPELPSPIKVPTDFYPLSVLLDKGILFGIEPDLVQRRDTTFSFLRFTTRTHLFLPPILRHFLNTYNQPAAQHLSHHYQHLSYFPHALEVLLHDVLDEEVDQAKSPRHGPPSPTLPNADDRTALLPAVLSFLTTFPAYLDIVVACTRKTELASWRTLFAHLPAASRLFDESLARGALKTAAGYLLVLHTLEADGDGAAGRTPGVDRDDAGGHKAVALLARAARDGEWDLCREIARFLVAMDGSGRVLRDALGSVGLEKGGSGGSVGAGDDDAVGLGLGLGIASSSESESGSGAGDYFGSK